MRSKAGHREWLLDRRVKTAGAAISKSRHGTYAAWAFSGDSINAPNLSLPDPIEVSRGLIKWFSKHKLQLYYNKGRGQKPIVGGEGMLRIPVSLVLGFIGALGIVLGAHGIYVYFSRLELMLGGEASKLFLSVNIPIRLREAVEWMSMKGVESWFIPAAILVGGIVLWNYSNVMTLISGFLRKIRLW